MPYSNSMRPPFTNTETESFGERCEVITPGASDQLDPSGRYYKYMTVAAAGDATFVPYRNDDADTITATFPAGMPIHGRIRRVTSATATLLGWFD